MTYVFVHGPVFIRTAQSHQLAGFPQRAALWDGPYGDMIHVAAACERTAGSPLLLSVLAASLCLPLVGTCWARKARASPYIGCGLQLFITANGKRSTANDEFIRLNTSSPGPGGFSSLS